MKAILLVIFAVLNTDGGVHTEAFKMEVATMEECKALGEYYSKTFSIQGRGHGVSWAAGTAFNQAYCFPQG